MTRIVIDDVHNVEDLLIVLGAVQAAFAARRADFDSQQEYFSRDPAGVGERLRGLPRLQPGEVRQIVPDLPGPIPYVPCPLRGSHLRLADCWLCWSDVQRKDCSQADVLSSKAWDLALVVLTASQIFDVPAPRPKAPGVDTDEA